MKTIRIPSHWSPQQAWEVLELLESLHQAIWQTYEQPLVEVIRAELQQLDSDEQSSLDDDKFPHDDEIPF